MSIATFRRVLLCACLLIVFTIGYVSAIKPEAATLVLTLLGGPLAGLAVLMAALKE